MDNKHIGNSSIKEKPSDVLTYMGSPFRKNSLYGVKRIIAVASGKGGVGKSTVAANLAIALVNSGKDVAIIDADIYGPSIPQLFDIENELPKETIDGAKKMMIPIEKYGVKIMSIGFFKTNNKGLYWRGSMAANAILQLVKNTKWGEIDYMIVDFPPGTGDIQLSCLQKIKFSGAIIVTTSQEIALCEARKAASMFTHYEIEVPILGIVENMSWFISEKHPDEKNYLFGKDGGRKIASELKTVLLGQIPLVKEVGEATEKGNSVLSQKNKIIISEFNKIANFLLS